MGRGREKSIKEDGERNYSLIDEDTGNV